MIITKTGKYPIIPQTAMNSKGAYYQVRIAEITKVDKENHKIFCPDLGWIDWNLPVNGETKARR
jgi:hypothetical protein